MSVKRNILSYFSIVMFGFIIVSVVILLKVLYLKTIRRNYYEQKKSVYFEGRIPAKRGDILDANGNLLSTSVYRYDVFFDPNTDFLRKWSDSLFKSQAYTLAVALSKGYGDKEPEYYFKLIMNARKKGLRGILLLKDLSLKQKDSLRNLPIFRYGRNRGGLIINEKTRRILIYNGLARRTIGFIKNGKSFGLENVYNGYLSGINGKALYQRLPGGIKRKLYVIQKAEDGADIVSTIDIQLQDIVENALKKRLIELDADYGVAILMDVKTGYIRALANLGKLKDSVYFENRNYAVGVNYEPGSVMKLASFIAIFENSDVSLDTIVDTGNGIWQVAKDYAIRDYKKGGFGKITLKRVFELSSNVGTAKLVYNFFRDKPQEFVQVLDDMGFSRPLDLKLEYVPKPIFHIPGDKEWGGITTLLQMSIGYSLSVTPMHIITLYNAVANNGKMVKPQIVSSVVKNGRIIKKFKPEYINTAICSQSTIDKIKKLLRGVVENGTGKHYVKSDLVDIAGKSGTAWSYNEQSGSYRTQTGIVYNSTFVGYFPAENPKYTCLVMIHNPKRKAFGGASAAGIVLKRIAEKIYAFDYDLQKDKNYIVNNQKAQNTLPDEVKGGYKSMITYNLKHLGIKYRDKTNSQWVKVEKTNNFVYFRPMHLRKNIMPDLIGLSLKDAMYLAQMYNLEVKAEGCGKVVYQSIKPGEFLQQKQKLILRLK